MSTSSELLRGLAYYEDRRALGLDAAPPMIGPFRIVELLGRGSFGRVWRAWDTRLERDVALKLTRDAELAEAQALAAVRSPHVVTVHCVEQLDGHVVTVMEVIEGRRLDQWLADHPSVDEVLAVLHQIGEGLSAIHAAGLAHKDLKPANLIVADGQAKIVDLGLAKIHGPVGSPKWSAPEVLDGLAADQRSDQYSFGLVCREALAQVGAESLGESFLALALERDPAARWSTLAEGLAVLPRRRASRRGMLIAVVSAMIGAVSVWGALGGGGEGSIVPAWVEPLGEINDACELAEDGDVEEAFELFAAHRGDLQRAEPSLAAEASAKLADAIATAVATGSTDTDRLIGALVAAAAAEDLEAQGDDRSEWYRLLEAGLRP